jgi:hypothetical protein
MSINLAERSKHPLLFRTTGLLQRAFFDGDRPGFGYAS